MSDIDRFDNCLSELDNKIAFFLGYYVIEKGLPALLLSPDAKLRKRAFDNLPDKESASEIIQLRERLGRIRSIRGVLLEATGFAGGLGQRDWVLKHENGGNTVETFYHLVCMLVSLLPDADFRVESAIGGIAVEAKSEFLRRHSAEAAETATTAVLSVDEIEICLACAKYVSPRVHERWMEICYENGSARIDFESSTLVVKHGDSVLEVGARQEPKHVMQFLQAIKHFESQDADCLHGSFRKSLILTLMIREHLGQEPIIQYATGQLAETWRDNVISGANWGETLIGPSTVRLDGPDDLIPNMKHKKKDNVQEH